MVAASALLAVVAYLAAAACLVLPLVDRPAPRRPVALGLAAIAVALHLAMTLGMHQGGVSLHFFAALSLVALVVAALTLLVNLFRPVAGLGVIVFPLAALLLAVDTWLAPSTAPLPIEWQIKLHVAFALLGYGMLSIAALLAILLALQERALRKHRLDSGLIRALPPLTLTEALMFRLIGAGFVLLTLTLLSGVLFVDNLFAQHLVQKTVLSIAAWLVFGVLLFGRWRWGWRGRRAVRLTLAGMVILLLAFFGSKFVFEVLLHRTP
jgi:ABC-type uncharacterized transport system permease subunit